MQKILTYHKIVSIKLLKGITDTPIKWNVEIYLPYKNVILDIKLEPENQIFICNEKRINAGTNIKYVQLILRDYY